MTAYHAALAAAFDRTATSYDAQHEENPLHAAMRQVTLRLLRQSFPPGSRVVELGCGTGTEAVALASDGVRIVATDIAPAMVAEAAERARAAGVEERIEFIVAPASEVPDRLQDRGPFDGAYSSFGPLNCEPDIAGVLRRLAGILRPGARLVLTLVNRTCAWELGLYTLLGRPGKAFRRIRWPARANLSPGGSVEVYIHGTRTVVEGLLPEYAHVRWRGLSVLRPPPYLRRQWAALGLDERLVEGADEWLAHCSVLRNLGDHVIVTARRR